MLSQDVKNRLYNFKFEQALRQLERDEEAGGELDLPTSEEKELVEALNRLLGDSGWIYGDMDIIVSAALKSLDVFEEDEMAWKTTQ